MIRIFAALPIPIAISQQLTALQKGLPGASWRPIENFHITLRFFGEVSRELAFEIDREIAEIPALPFQLQLRGLGSFGKREPRAVWAGVDASEPLLALAGACERVARRMGLPPEKRPYRPHVTLAYCRGTTPDEASEFVQRNIGFSAEAWTADRFHLYSSRLGSRPSRYIAEADYPLL